jgi:hypothetical protein
VRSILVFLVFLLGCSVPVDPNYDAVNEAMAEFPDMTRAEAQRWVANDRASDYFRSEAPDQHLMDVICTDSLSGEVRETAIAVRIMSECLGAVMMETLQSGLHKYMTFHDCVDTIVTGVRVKSFGGTNPNPDVSAIKCTYKINPLFEEDLRDPRLDPDKLDNDDVTRQLIQAPKLPVWLIGLFVVGAGGVVLVTGGAGAAFLPALCVLSEGGPACPSNPEYPWGQTPQPGGGT